MFTATMLHRSQLADIGSNLKSGNFDVNDKERVVPQKKFQDEELEELLDIDPGQTLEELSEALGVDRSTVGKRLHALGMI